MKHRHGILLLAVLLVAGYWWLRYRSAEPAGVELAGAPSDTPTIYDGQAGATQAPMSTYSQQNSSIIGLILSHHPSYESPVGLAGGLGSYQGDANPSVLPVSSAPPITDATDGVDHTPTVRDTRSRRRRGRHRSRPARRSSVKQLHNIGGLGNLSHLSGLDY
jgi:hypothetical protein